MTGTAAAPSSTRLAPGCAKRSPPDPRPAQELRDEAAERGIGRSALYAARKAEDIAIAKERHPGLPDVPSLVENGFRDLPLNVWFALYAPKQVPSDVQQKLSETLEKVLSDEGLRGRAFEAGALVKYAGPDKVARRLRAEIAGWKDTAQAANIRAD